MPQIPSLPTASSLNGLEYTVITKSGITYKTTLASLPLSNVSISALNNKANTSHTHTLSNLTQSGATSGQSIIWSGTAWVPATITGGGGVSDHLLLSNIGANTHAQIDSHISSTSNPHSVTKIQVGLSNVDNTSDTSKPISTLTQTALDLKAPLVGGLIPLINLPPVYFEDDDFTGDGLTIGTAYKINTANNHVHTGTITAPNFIKTGGTSSQFLMADGSVDGTSKQETLVSGTNIKTINGVTILGSGDIVTSSIPTDIQEFSTAGSFTWTKPVNAKIVSVTTVGAGGGGGSARKGASGSVITGGGGGGGGGISSFTFDAILLGTTETVVVGTGGTGGASQSTNSTNGFVGTVGGLSSFGIFLKANGGGAGSFGHTNTGAGGSVGTGLTSSGGTGGTSNATGGAGTTPGGSNFGALGGASGGGIPIGATFSGGASGNGGASFVNHTSFGSNSGTTDGASGSNGATPVYQTGFGGGSGASSVLTNGGSGGNGTRGGGGGGGGAALDSVGNSGAGGNGGTGYVIVTTYF